MILRVARILLLIIIIFPQHLQGQSSSISRKFSKVRVNVPKLIDSAQRISDVNPSKAFDLLEKALSESISSEDKNSEALTYAALGNINNRLNQFDLSIQYFQKAINIFEELKNYRELDKTHSSLGFAYSNTKEYTKAIDCYQKNLKYAQNLGNIDEISRIKLKIANIKSKTGDYETALETLSEILELEKNINDKDIIIEAESMSAEIYSKTNRKQKALLSYKKTAELAKRNNNVDLYSNSMNQQGNIYRQQNDVDKELEVRNELLKTGENVADYNLVAEQNREIGNIYVTQNQSGKAISYFNRSIDIADKAGALEQKSMTLQSLSAAYSKNAQYDKALEVYKQYVSTVDAIYKRREQEINANANLIATLNRKIQRLDLIEKELDISHRTLELLRYEQTVNKKEIKTVRLIGFSAILALLILSIALYTIYRSSIQKRRANQLLALKSLRSQMNPHFIYNSLNSVNNYISKNDEKSANKYLSEFSLLMRAVMDNSKHDFVLLSSELDIIKHYLSLEHSRFNDKFDYQIDINTQIDGENIYIPPMLIQPFIENSIWHGLRYLDNKGFLKLSVGLESKQLIIIIEDNGIGRQKSEELKTRFQKEHNSTGLKNIENRINIIEELFKLRINVAISDLDNKSGTKVVISFPIITNHISYASNT